MDPCDSCVKVSECFGGSGYDRSVGHVPAHWLPNCSESSVGPSSEDAHSGWGLVARWGLAVGLLFMIVAGRPVVEEAAGQGQTVTRTAGEVANLFATIDPPRAIDGVRLSVPSGWTVESVDLLRFGTEAVPVELHRPSATEVHVRAARSFRGSHELVLQVRLPEAPGRRTWTVRAGLSSADGEDVLHRQRVSIEAPQTPEEANQAVSFEGASEPVPLRLEGRSFLTQRSSFWVSFWLRTTGRNEVVLSTWSGDEAEAYPIELLVDRSGRLRLYTGRPGAHQALWTNTPVADGRWHQVAAAYDATHARLRLLLNGTPVDSLQIDPLPRPAGPVPMALGGRPGDRGNEGASGPTGFSGRLDEVRLSEKIGLGSGTSPQRTASLADGDGLLLDFEEEPGLSASPDAIAEWPDGVRRVPSTLSLRSPLRNVRAQSDGRSVTLRWTVESAEAGRFAIERSIDRETFAPLVRLRPEQARRTDGEDALEYTYTDTSVPEQVVFYRIRREREDGSSRPMTTIKVGVGASMQDTAAVSLLDNFPNPFRETTTIAYEVHESVSVTVSVWTVTGTRVRTITDRHHEPGYYEKQFRATSLPSGPYFVQLKTPRGTQSNRMVVLK